MPFVQLQLQLFGLSTIGYLEGCHACHNHPLSPNKNEKKYWLGEQSIPIQRPEMKLLCNTINPKETLPNTYFYIHPSNPVHCPDTPDPLCGINHQVHLPGAEAAGAVVVVAAEAFDTAVDNDEAAA